MITESTESITPALTNKLTESLLERHNDRSRRFQRNRLEYDGLFGGHTTGKCLPYYSFPSWHHLWHLGCDQYIRCAVLRSIIEKMISYVVSDKVTYTVAVDPAFEGTVSDDVVTRIDRIVSLNTRDPAWHKMQEQSIRRKFRDGEYFRWVAASGGKIRVRFIEPTEIRPNTNVNVKEQWPYGIQYLETEEGVVDATLPINYSYLPMDGDSLRDFDTIPANSIQHNKFGVDDNDPRGLPLGWMAFCELNKLNEVNEAMCELALTQASFAAIRTYKENVRNEVLDRISKNEKQERDILNDGRPEPGRIIDAKGFEVDIPGASIRAGQFVEIIAQQFRIIGALLDMPEHVASAEADTGNRSSLISAEGPFDRRIRREQTELGNLDVELLWKAVISAFSSASESVINQMRESVIITPNFQSAIARDPDKQVDSSIKLLAAGAQSRQGVIAKNVGDPRAVLAQIKREREEDSIEQEADLSRFLAPEVRDPEPTTDNQITTP